MLNAPITEDENLNAFLFSIQNNQENATGVVADISTGAISDSESGRVIGYLYRYMHVRYAADNIGTGMSSSETGQTYFGIQNTDSTTASTAPADYTWFLTTGFGTTYHVYYMTTGGRQIQFVVATAPPTGYTLAPTTPIDLDTVSGSIGTAGVSALMAYKIQSQSAATPTFSATTAGNAIPAGWTGTLGTPAVGQTVWYIFGRYNSAATVVDGIPANTTSWGGLTAASVFQDIRSDNWNGSNPPVFSSPGTWGTAGYYIRRDDGTVIANNLGARGTIQAGTAARSGTTMTGTGANLQSDGTFAIGNSTAHIVGDGTNVTIRGFINDIYSGSVWSGYSGGAVGSYSETNTSSPRTIDSGKYTCTLSGSVSVNGTYAAYRRVYVGVQFIVNINGSDTLYGNSGVMIPVANGGPYDSIIPVSLSKQFDMAPYTGGTVILRTYLIVQTVDLTSNVTGYVELNTVYTGNVTLDVREFNL